MKLIFPFCVSSELFRIVDTDPSWINDFVKNNMKWKH